MLIQPNDVVLFQGDSITDAGRDRDTREPNVIHGLGRGYASIAAATLLADRPDLNLRFLNRGVSGDVVQQMLDRWQRDCLDLRPDVLSVLIGVNDTARPIENSPHGDTVENYDRKLRRCIDLAREQNPKLRLVVGQPFAWVRGYVTDAWRPGLVARQQIAERVAADYDAVFVPYQSMFDQLLDRAADAYWLPDGVHPSPGGHVHMARLWLDCVTR